MSTLNRIRQPGQCTEIYQTTHDRAFRQCLKDLLNLRSEKPKAEIGFAS